MMHYSSGRAQEKGMSRGELITIFAIVVILFFTNHQLSTASLYQDNQILINLLNDSSIKIDKAVFQQSGMISEDQSKEAFLATKKKIEEVFGINMVRIINENQNQTDLLKFQGESDLSSNSKLQIVWVGKKEEGESLLYTSYIAAQVSSSESDLWEGYHDYLKIKLKELGIDPKINSSFQGRTDQMMTMDEQVDFIRNMFTTVDGKVTEGLTSHSVVSLSGYSEKLQHSVANTSGVINMQIAARASLSEKVTFITIGNPIITMEY